MNSQLQTATRNSRSSIPVDNSDWLKTAAIIQIMVGHFGYFFVENADWWSVVGRLAAPTLFFFIGYANSRTVPFSWIWLGVVLTMLDSWNNNWTWMTLNILLSYSLIRILRPYVRYLITKYGWIAFVFLNTTLLVMLPITGEFLEYGTEGWLWALFGLYHRMEVDGKSNSDIVEADKSVILPSHPKVLNLGLMRLLTCIIAVLVYARQEQIEFEFPDLQFGVFVLSLGILTAILCVFLRGPSRFQPPEFAAAPLRFIGRHTLEIYAIQLAGSELIIKFVPSLTV